MAPLAKELRRHVSRRKREPAAHHGSGEPLLHAVRIIHRVCCLAGLPSLIDDIRTENRRLRSAIRHRDTRFLFDWLMSAVSYQGISDQVAEGYINRHGQATWHQIDSGLSASADCPKLRSYWHYYNCRFNKGSRTCAEPDHIDRCPLPRHNLRNGRLNQTAYSLFFFIRDIANGDLVSWIDTQLEAADQPDNPDRVVRVQAALIEPLRNIYGASDKVLTMALSCLMLAAGEQRPRWLEVGGAMIAIDTLVHNFLHRTGILRQFRAEHAYGAACYRPGGCADLIRAVAARIDSRQFNPTFPTTFPRFVQHAIWRYCSQQGLNICNGNQINDQRSCDNVYCTIRGICDRIALIN